jgi:hypothetical protein
MGQRLEPGIVDPLGRVERLHLGQVVGVQGKCLDLFQNLDADGTVIQLRTCNGAASEVVWMSGAGELRMHTRCLNVTGGATANGTTVQLLACNSSAAEKWIQRPDGLLEDPISGRCLGTRNGADADTTPLVISDCSDSAPNQRWGLEFNR